MTAWQARRIALTTALALSAALALPMSASAATNGVDVAVSLGGNFPSSANSFGNVGINWTDAGSTDVTGITHLTVHLPAGLTTDGALMYMQPADYEFTEWVSADGSELDATFIGTMTPGQSDFMKLEVDSGAQTPTGNAVATVANARDDNTSNNRATVPVAPPDESSTPLPAAPAPVLTGVSAVSGPSAGGTAVTVHGRHLADGFVRFGARLADTTAPSAPAPHFACTENACTVTTPPGTGLAPVTVTTPGGTTRPAPFAYYGPPPPPPPAPTLEFLSATSGPAAGGTQLVIGGSDLDQGSITFGAVPGLDTSCGPTLCTTTAPPGAPGSVEVTVHTAGGSAGLPFTYT